MGTRHLIAVQLNGKYPVAQYGQWDGYPDAQGVSVLRFLHGANLHAFAAKCGAAQFITPEEYEQLYLDAGAEKGAQFVSCEVADAVKKRNPQLSRDAGAEVLGMVLFEPDGIKLKDSLSFAGDSLMCEWCYVIDLDAGTFEVHKGFNKEPLDSQARFASQPVEGDYKQVRKVAEWKLDALPSERDFLAKFKDGEDED